MANYVTPANFDKNKPYKIVDAIARGKCPKCGERAHGRIKVKGNIGKSVVGTVSGFCTSKKCGNKVFITLEYTVTIK